VVDTREVSGMLSATDLWSLAQRLVRYRSSARSRSSTTRASSTCAADNHGFNAQAFTSFEDAMDWLLGA